NGALFRSSPPKFGTRRAAPRKILCKHGGMRGKLSKKRNGGQGKGDRDLSIKRNHIISRNVFLVEWKTKGGLYEGLCIFIGANAENFRQPSRIVLFCRKRGSDADAVGREQSVWGSSGMSGSG